VYDCNRIYAPIACTQPFCKSAIITKFYGTKYYSVLEAEVSYLSKSVRVVILYPLAFKRGIIVFSVVGVHGLLCKTITAPGYALLSTWKEFMEGKEIAGSCG